MNTPEAEAFVAKLRAICETCLGLGVVDDYNSEPGDGPYWPADMPCPNPDCGVTKKADRTEGET